MMIFNIAVIDASAWW